MSADAPEMDTFAAAYLKKSGTTTGRKFYEALSSKFPNLTEDEFADILRRLAAHDQIDLYDERPVSFRAFLTAWERNLWYYVSVIVCFSAALTAYAVPPNSPFLLLRWVLGLLFVIFLPGYATVQALLPTAQPSGLERFALSIGVSLVLDMLAGLALNYTPWGIRLVPILLLLSTLTICFATLALARQFRETRRRSAGIIAP